MLILGHQDACSTRRYFPRTTRCFQGAVAIDIAAASNVRPSRAFDEADENVRSLVHARAAATLIHENTSDVFIQATFRCTSELVPEATWFDFVGLRIDAHAGVAWCFRRQLRCICALFVHQVSEDWRCIVQDMEHSVSHDNGVVIQTFWSLCREHLVRFCDWCFDIARSCIFALHVAFLLLCVFFALYLYIFKSQKIGAASFKIWNIPYRMTMAWLYTHFGLSAESISCVPVIHVFSLFASIFCDVAHFHSIWCHISENWCCIRAMGHSLLLDDGADLW